MFSSALKSFSSNITSNYALSSTPSSYSGPWKIYDAKKKSTGKAVSVFVFDKTSLEPQASLRRSGGSLKKIHEEVIERLKKEGASLARLRHPSILELAEPVEETRNGGLMFATEPVTASLAGLLAEKDVQEKAAGVRGRQSRLAGEDPNDGGRRGQEVEIDDLEIQKGLLQVAKGLEFLHESAGLVHANLTPEAIYVNAKSDWKISGLGFSTPPDQSTHPTSVAPISLTEVLNHDSRLPRFVQLNIDYTSPDFVIDSNITPSADLFSLGLLIIALFNSPHTSPLQTNSSPSTYKRLFTSSSASPSPRNQFLSSRPLPKELVSSVLPRLITRHAAQRLTAREFQQSQYFDNILVSTIRFLDSLPAKTPNEKSQFMKGLPRILSQFPKSVLEKKLLPALLEEMKDRDLLALTLQNIFKIVKMLPSGRRAFIEKVIPRLREVFLTSAGAQNSKGVAAERDTSKEAGLIVVLEHINTVTEICSGKEFKDEILPLIILALESPTHPLVDVSLRRIPNILPVLDYTTTRNELFPVVASVFSKTSSLGIKIRGLEAFVILCGGKLDKQDIHGDGHEDAGAEDRKKTVVSPVLDKYTVQEKVVPLLKAIKTKEPAVMMAALKVFRQVGNLAESDFIALEVLPVLWSMCLGPLLNLEQFRCFMDLIKSLSERVEQEQIRKLRELSSSAANDSFNGRSEDFLSFGALGGANGTGGNEGGDTDFERLVTGEQSGKSGKNAAVDNDGGWGSDGTGKIGESAPVLSWTTPPRPSTQTPNHPLLLSNGLSAFTTLTPSSQLFQPQPLQPPLNVTSGVVNPWATTSPRTSSTPSLTTLNSLNQRPSSNPTFGNHHHHPQGSSNAANISSTLAFSIPSPPPPPPPTSAFTIPSVPPPPPTSAFSIPSIPHLPPAPSSSSPFSILPPPPRPASSSSPSFSVPIPPSLPLSSSTTIPPTSNPAPPNASRRLDQFESLL